MALASELVWVSSCTRRPSFFPCPTGSDTQRHSLRPTLWAQYTIRSGGCPPASTLGRARSTRGGCSPRRRTRHSEVSPRSPWVPLGWSKSVRHLSTARTEVRTAARLSALPPAVNKDTTGERQEQGKHPYASVPSARLGGHYGTACQVFSRKGLGHLRPHSGAETHKLCATETKRNRTRQRTACVD